MNLIVFLQFVFASIVLYCNNKRELRTVHCCKNVKNTSNKSDESVFSFQASNEIMIILTCIRFIQHFFSFFDILFAR
jgi:hypothetical protein